MKVHCESRNGDSTAHFETFTSNAAFVAPLENAKLLKYGIGMACGKDHLANGLWQRRTRGVSLCYS